MYWFIIKVTHGKPGLMLAVALFIAPISRRYFLSYPTLSYLLLFFYTYTLPPSVSVPLSLLTQYHTGASLAGMPESWAAFVSLNAYLPFRALMAS